MVAGVGLFPDRRCVVDCGVIVAGVTVVYQERPIHGGSKGGLYSICLWSKVRSGEQRSGSKDKESNCERTDRQ